MENMMTPDTLPDLPTPKYTETIRGVPCITLTEHEHLMRAYALQAITEATQAEVTDQLIESEFQRCGGKWNGDQWVIEDADLHPFARTILALRPVQVPMTPDEIVNARNEVQAHSIVSFAKGVRAAEAHHFGITAQAKKE